jgi:hypothetical protein
VYNNSMRSDRISMGLDSETNKNLEYIREISGTPKTETVRRLVKKEIERITKRAKGRDLEVLA